MLGGCLWCEEMEEMQSKTGEKYAHECGAYQQCCEPEMGELYPSLMKDV
jgi:hypothetical protein